jgi:imidazolonepropionase-like amidohydrolase
MLNAAPIGVVGLVAFALAKETSFRARYAGAATHQLMITDARVLNVRDGSVREHQTILIDTGRITAVLDDAQRPTRSRAFNLLDAHGRLLTPGLVDAHFHSEMLFGDSVVANGGLLTHLRQEPDSIRAYRERIAAAYLPHGITLVRDLGSAVRDFPLLKAWMMRDSSSPDFLASGAQLVSPERERVLPPFQIPVADSAAGAAQVRAFAAAGFRNIKLYWRLREPAFQGALVEADRLGLTTTAHLDEGIVTFNRALTLGLRHFEHAHTMAVSVMRPDEREAATRTAAALLGGGTDALSRRGGFPVYVLEHWRTLGDHDVRILALMERLRATGSTVTPTLHVIAQRAGASTFSTPPLGIYDDVRDFTPAQRARLAEDYRILARTVARMDSIGVHLAVGSDTQEPGRSVLDELCLLRDAGIPSWRVLRIATLYSAEAVGQGREYGAIEKGRRADLVLFDDDPLRDMHAVFGPKTIVKDGIVAIRR